MLNIPQVSSSLPGLPVQVTPDGGIELPPAFLRSVHGVIELIGSEPALFRTLGDPESPLAESTKAACRSVKDSPVPPELVVLVIGDPAVSVSLINDIVFGCPAHILPSALRIMKSLRTELFDMAFSMVDTVTKLGAALPEGDRKEGCDFVWARLQQELATTPICELPTLSNRIGDWFVEFSTQRAPVDKVPPREVLLSGLANIGVTSGSGLNFKERGAEILDAVTARFSPCAQLLLQQRILSIDYTGPRLSDRQLALMVGCTEKKLCEAVDEVWLRLERLLAAQSGSQKENSSHIGESLLAPELGLVQAYPLITEQPAKWPGKHQRPFREFVSPQAFRRFESVVSELPSHLRKALEGATMFDLKPAVVSRGGAGSAKWPLKNAPTGKALLKELVELLNLKGNEEGRTGDRVPLSWSRVFSVVGQLPDVTKVLRAGVRLNAEASFRLIEQVLIQGDLQTKAPALAAFAAGCPPNYEVLALSRLPHNYRTAAKIILGAKSTDTFSRQHIVSAAEEAQVSFPMAFTENLLFLMRGASAAVGILPLSEFDGSLEQQLARYLSCSPNAPVIAIASGQLRKNVEGACASITDFKRSEGGIGMFLLTQPVVTALEVVATGCTQPEHDRMVKVFQKFTRTAEAEREWREQTRHYELVAEALSAITWDDLEGMKRFCELLPSEVIPCQSAH